jgi:hypothetical protein
MKNIITTELLKQLKESEVATHFWHLQTNSYAEHKALGNYYEELQELFDNLVEITQGSQETVLNFPDTLNLPMYALRDAHFDDLCMTLDKLIEDTNDHMDIQDAALDIKNLVNKTKYLLTLK